MTGLVRPYPLAWHDRYEAEILDLLEQRRLSLDSQPAIELPNAVEMEIPA